MIKHLVVANSTPNELLRSVGKELTRQFSGPVAKAIRSLGHYKARVVVVGYPDSDWAHDVLLVDLNGKILAGGESGDSLRGKTYITFTSSGAKTLEVQEDIPLAQFLKDYVPDGYFPY